MALPATPLWSFPSASDVVGWRPVLTPLATNHRATGAVRSGTVYAGYAPAGDFSLTLDGRTVSALAAFGWASQYRETNAGSATLAFNNFPYVPLFVLVELIGWVVLAIMVIGWRRRRRRSAPADVGES